MRFKCLTTGVLLIIILLLVLITPNSFAGNYDRTYRAQVQFGLINRELHVSVSPSLYEYYSGKNIRLTNDNQYSKLVTPCAVKSIAESIRNLTRDKPRSYEEFANAVLTLVHQIPYDLSGVKYPVETLVENSGKCDTLSLLAASIMKAGGLDVVLLYFKGVHHINVGVYLPYQPRGTWWWLEPKGYEFEGKKYWMAECTSAMEWKVGDVPPLLAEEEPYVISLEDSEVSSPSSVSSKWGNPLNSSSISINLSSEPQQINDQERTFIISGSISPAYPNETVVVYFSQDGISYDAFKTETDHWGNYSFSWNLNSTGTYYVRTSWSGNLDCAGADSEMLTIFLGFPQSVFPFVGPDYYYSYRPATRARVSSELRDRQGVEDFLNIQLSGTGVVLTGEFIILKSGQMITIPTETITIPASNMTIGFGRRRMAIIPIPERTETIPVIPEGLYPKKLPENFSQTVNNKFSFILRNDIGCNYSVSARGMDDSDIAQISQPNGNGTVFMNASACIKENTWYKVVAMLSENESTATLYDVNGTLLESTPIAHDRIYNNDLVILIADNTEKAVAFKNLRVATLDEPAQPLLEENKKAGNEHELLAPFVTVTILLATAFAALVYRKRKSSRTKCAS